MPVVLRQYEQTVRSLAPAPGSCRVDALPEDGFAVQLLAVTNPGPIRLDVLRVPFNVRTLGVQRADGCRKQFHEVL